MLQRIVFVLGLISFFSFPAYAGFDEGKKAYDQKQWTQAITELRPLAEAGDDRAMVILGNMYNEGLGVMKDPKEAFSLYKRAATQKNNADAMVAVAAMYTSGIGVNRNLNASLQWFGRAAQLGNQIGAFFYATVLFRGNKSPDDTISQDTYNAYKWYKIAAKDKKLPKIQQASEKLAKRIADKNLSAEEVAKADKEAVDWKPVEAASLGPAPTDPVTAAPAPPKN